MVLRPVHTASKTDRNSLIRISGASALLTGFHSDRHVNLHVRTTNFTQLTHPCGQESCVSSTLHDHTISRARTIGSCYDFDAWSLVCCAMPKSALMSGRVSSRVPPVDIHAHT